MTRRWTARDALGWKAQLGLSVCFAIVLFLSLAAPITDCEVGTLGDVSAILRTVWTLTTGSATLVSFVLTARKYRAEANETSSDDPVDSHTAIHVEGIEGDVDLSVTLGDTQTDTADESHRSSAPTDDDSGAPENIDFDSPHDSDSNTRDDEEGSSA